MKEAPATPSFRVDEEPRRDETDAGVGFAVMTTLAGKLVGVPKGVKDRLMSMRLSLARGKFHTIVSVYTPTLNNPEETKSKFYKDVNGIPDVVPNADKLIILGDFNARVGRDLHLGRGDREARSGQKGILLLQTCAEHDLLIKETVFCLPTRNKTSWAHPRSKHWHLID